MTDIQLKYFNLLTNVGTHHCYQYFLIFLEFYAFSLMSIAVSSITYLFMNYQFDCPSLGIQTVDCESYICEEYKTQELSSLPFTHKYNTIATEFGPYYCDHNISLGFYRSFQSIGPMFKALDSWRKFVIVCYIIPGIVFLILVFCIIQDSPKFLLRKGEDQAIQSLNRIARINRQQFRYVQGDLTEYMQYEAQNTAIKNQITPYDLFRYKSLRRATITLSIGYFSVNFIYYGLSSATDKIGYNPFLNGVLLGVGSLIGIPVSFFVANRTPRREFGIFYNLFSGVCSLIIFFIQVPSNCQFCSQSTAEIVLMILMRLANVIQNQILFLHMIQSFPSVIRTIGIGIPNLMGSIGLFCSQFAIVGLFEVSLKFPFVIVSICCLLFGINYFFAPETLNSPLKEQIDEIKEQAKIKDRENESEEDHDD